MYQSTDIAKGLCGSLTCIAGRRKLATARLDVERAVRHASQAYVYRALYTALSCEISAYLSGTMDERVLNASRVDTGREAASRDNAGRENERIGSRECGSRGR